MYREIVSLFDDGHDENLCQKRSCSYKIMQIMEYLSAAIDDVHNASCHHAINKQDLILSYGCEGTFILLAWGFFAMVPNEGDLK